MASKKQLWYLDSGCSKHMIGDALQLINLKWKPDGYVTYGDNNRGRILGVGDIGGDDNITIRDVLLVDGLKHNILIISQLCNRGYKISFELEQCLIADFSRISPLPLIWILCLTCRTSHMWHERWSICNWKSRSIMLIVWHNKHKQ